MKPDVVLIFPYYMSLDPTQRKQRSPLPPLGLMYIASSLRAAGYRVQILDCTFMKPRDAERELRLLSPNYVGVYTSITLTEHGFRLSRLAKEIGATVIHGGPDISIDPTKYLASGLVDYGVIGEGEDTIVELLGALERKGDVSGVRGVAYLEGADRMRYTGFRPPTREPDRFPHPARDLIDNRRYQEVWREDHGYTLATVFTARGCPYGCFFCTSPVAPYGRRYAGRSPLDVVEELEEVVYKWGYQAVWFVDDVFTVQRKRTLELCRLIRERGIDVQWSCFTRADLVDQELLYEMRRAGCRLIFYGAESGSQKILDMMNRQMRVEQVLRAAAMTRKAGIGIHAFFQIGYPGETYETILETIRFLKRLMPDTFSFTMTYPLAGTELYARVSPYLSRTREWRRPLENRQMFRTDIPEAALKFAVWKASLEFYAYRRATAGQLPFRIIEPIFRRLTDLILKAIVPPKKQSIWERHWPRGFISPPTEKCFVVKAKMPILVQIERRRP
jgi:anaerobic magnesium-protoporphyrin IX monomethyl ester cyclase